MSSTTKENARAPWRWPGIGPGTALALLAVVAVIGFSEAASVRLEQLAAGSTTPWSRPFAWELSSAFAAWLGLPVIFTAAVNAPGPRVGWLRFLGLHATGFVLFSLVHIGGMLGSRHLLYALLGWGAYDYGQLGLRVPMEMAQDLVTYGASATIWIFVDAWRDRQARALHAARLESELRNAQLCSLTGQLQPHFLFNALNTVSAVMYEDLPRTDRLLSDLGELLRASLDGGGTTWTLGEERAHVQRFVAVLTARFGERLSITWDFAPGLESISVPRFALQALVENAVKHNQERRERLEVRLRGRRDGEGVRLEVEDNGRGFARAAPSSGPGLGLAQLERVLALLYGEHARLERGAGPEGGALVALCLPGGGS